MHCQLYFGGRNLIIEQLYRSTTFWIIVKRSWIHSFMPQPETEAVSTNIVLGVQRNLGFLPPRLENNQSVLQSYSCCRTAGIDVIRQFQRAHFKISSYTEVLQVPPIAKVRAFFSGCIQSIANYWLKYFWWEEALLVIQLGLSPGSLAVW